MTARPRARARPTTDGASKTSRRGEHTSENQYDDEEAYGYKGNIRGDDHNGVRQRAKAQEDIGGERRQQE